MADTVHSPSAEVVNGASQVQRFGESGFDEAILGGFARVHSQGGVLACDPEGIVFRKLDGLLGCVASWHEEHFKKKRTDGLHTSDDIAVLIEHDPIMLASRFNFTKANAAEFLFDLELDFGEEEDGGDPGSFRWRDPVLANLSPLAFGHVVIPVRCGALRPQVMTESLLHVGLRLCEKSRRADFRVVFNSRGAFASVNHFHFHGLYLKHCSLLPGNGCCLPIELVGREVLLQRVGLRIEVIRSPAYFLPAFVFSGTPTSEGDSVWRTVWQLVTACQERDIPHNLVIRPIFAAEGFVQGAAARTPGDTAATAEQAPVAMEVVVVPRRQQRHHDVEDAGYNGAVLEVCGLFIARSREHFDTFTESSIAAKMRGNIALPDEDFEALMNLFSQAA
eukprot:TRINITY_DN68382_c0_g1_i1.p1 TRINITY_DN68382_c0_g1~~TRINITY_DN68382_c0_g1_i1.p1  ORF type:complete len:403 (-),score=76.64 TRINITY_DN68382_c0_g1_i1:201-1373(-)